MALDKAGNKVPQEILDALTDQNQTFYDRELIEELLAEAAVAASEGWFVPSNSTDVYEGHLVADEQMMREYVAVYHSWIDADQLAEDMLALVLEEMVDNRHFFDDDGDEMPDDELEKEWEWGNE